MQKIFEKDYKEVVDILRKYPHNLSKGFKVIADKYGLTPNAVCKLYYYNRKFKAFVHDYPVVEVVSGNHKLMIRNNKNQIITKEYRTPVRFYCLDNVLYTIK